MKCLIASTDTLARVSAQKLLSELNVPVQAVANGAAAVVALQKPDGPEIAILDVALPGLGGVDVAMKLREGGRWVFVILCLPKDATQPPAGTEGLADAILTRPLSLDALRAAVTKALEGPPKPVAAEAAAATSAPAIRRPPHLTGSTSAAAPTTGSAAPAPFAGLKPLANGQQLLVKALCGLGLESVAVVPPTAAQSAAEMSAWSVLVLPGKSVWIDLLVESDRGSMRQLFTAMTGNAEPSDDDQNDVMRETVNIVQGTFKTAFQNEKLEVFTPVLPKNIESERIGDWRDRLADPIRYVFSSGPTRIAVTLFPKIAQAEKRKADYLRASQVIAQPILAPGCDDVVLVPKGTMLTEHSIEKIRNVADNEAEGFTVETIEHSPLTEALVRILETV